MKKIIFTIASILAVTSVFIACSNENDAINYEDYKNQRMKYEYIDFSVEMSSKVKTKKIHEAEQRILDNIRIVDGKISLSHTSAEELCLEKEYFEAMKYLLERVENPYEIIMPRTRQVILPNGESLPEDDINKLYIDLLVNEFLDSNFEKKCFNHYWYGNGETMYLTSEEWSGIKQHAESKYTPSNSNNAGTASSEISFYDNPTYNLALGTAEIFFSGSTAVGLKDDYNFNPEAWGVRETDKEIMTRIINHMGNIYNGKVYQIRYGQYSN